MKKQQSGFTLIELVIVIVILGLLAATALPRFADLTDDAQRASRSGVEGGVRSAAAIAHAQALAESVSNTANQSIEMEGTEVQLDFRYPDVTGILAAIPVQGGNITTATASGVVTWTINGASDCTVTYAETVSANVAPVISGDSACNN